MVEMQMEKEPVERLRSQRLGEDWIRTIKEGALEHLDSFCQPDVLSRLMTPRRYMSFDNATDLVAQIHQWFDKCGDFQIEQSRIGMVGERLGIFYRFLFQKQGAWQTVEQQLFCTLQDGRIAQLHLLCSGFQPVALGVPAVLTDVPGVGEVQPARDALLEIHTGAALSSSTCALLTPAIKTKLREMRSGQVLEVRVDDPSARDDIEAWCRLSGNPLLNMSAGEGSQLRFFVKKK